MTRRTTSRFVGIVMALGFSAWSGAGHAFTYMSASGNSCQPQTTDPIGHRLEGAVNSSGSSDAIFFCPLYIASQTSARALNSVVLKYKDGSDSIAFVCHAFQTFPWGSIYETPPKYTSSLAGGSPDPTTSYMGNNYLMWNNSELGPNISVQNLDTNFGFYCSVPRGNTSWIISYYSYY
jgi:hypothetical protein